MSHFVSNNFDMFSAISSLPLRREESMKNMHFGTLIPIMSQFVAMMWQSIEE